MSHPSAPSLASHRQATLAPELVPNNPKRRRQPERRWRGRLGALALLLALGQGPAWAADLIVNSLADAATAMDDLCTLREAITNANADSDTTGGDCAAGGGNDTITFTTGDGTILLASTLPAINDADGLTIDGTGQSVIVSGNDAVQVMLVGIGATLNLQNLTVANGSVPGGSFGGGILNFGTLTVTHSTFSGNSADFGGGIQNGPVLSPPPPLPPSRRRV